ncbi:alkaline phosphatase D family protein [Pararhizobium mangrovi]|uniref:Alkaline phosphatase family protein n=1 Tax=Pararhizobium mangrovi TaxID=2590452 RepID=A0A506UE96_9HYPH|nr:alkaline phosphatase D family protein [Pararhizobium mangrovi]TPW31284.1 alkaline phosphatase family protein [Pararhizobium mangrovi]
MQAFGPVLYFRGVEGDAWRLSALVGIPEGEEPALLSADDAEPVSPTFLARRRGLKLWRYDFTFVVTDEPAVHRYAIGERSFTVHLPAASAADLRLAFTACNGQEAGNVWPTSRERNANWLDLAEVHRERPFHLLLQGGDQLYADAIWEEVPVLKRWQGERWPRRRDEPFTDEMARATADAYFDSYCWLWAQPELAPLLAEIPSLMMWDDHDIFDGWGSYGPEWQESAVFQGVWSAAREAFCLFQLAIEPSCGTNESGHGAQHFGWSHIVGDVGILAPDLRSQRSRTRILSDEQRRDLTAALERMGGCRQIFLISTVPLVNVRLGLLERFFDWFPGHQTWQDDLIDQWPSVHHRREWADLLRELTDFSARTGARIVTLSGEIHLGAFGRISRGDTRIVQLTASGIVHPPPDAFGVRGLEWASRGVQRLKPDISVTFLPMPGTDRLYLRERNWLEIDRSRDAVQATWHSEAPNGGRHTFETDVWSDT